MKLVVTGTGRSGTGWCAAVLNSAGIYTGHERVFGPKQTEPDSLIDWQEYHADASWLAVPRLPLMGVRACIVIRHPLEVVASMSHIGFGMGDHDNAHASVARQYGMTPDLDGYLRFWLTWNRAAYGCGPIFTFHDLLDKPEILTRWAGAHHPPKDPGIVNDRPEWKANERPYVSWDSFTDYATVYHAKTLWESVCQ